MPVTTSDGSPRTAIVTVDDDPGVSRAVARDLRRRYGEQHRIVRAESGEAALEALREMKLRGDQVAVLLADYRMPQMKMRVKLGHLAGGGYDRSTLEALVGLQNDAAERVAKATALSAMQISDAEDAALGWLEEHHVAGGWELAPVFVQAGLDTGWFDQVVTTVAETVPADALDQALNGALGWLGCTVESELLLNEIEDSATRISTLVGAAKQYSQLDRSPHQVTDIREGLDSTLLMLGAKIGPDITVIKDYNPGLPRIPAYPGELNQVWANLIDNAVSAMQGAGTLTVTTARDRDRLLVEIGDTGPGMPAEIQKRIFEPFFTTKPVGEGTGLGLDISWRIVVNSHHGDLRVESVPGDTRFQVRLPLTPPNAAPQVAPQEGNAG